MSEHLSLGLLPLIIVGSSSSGPSLDSPIKPGNRGMLGERRNDVRTHNRRSQPSAHRRNLLNVDIYGWGLRSSESVQGSVFSRVFVPPTRQHTNPQPVIEGPELAVSGLHAKVRRDGYRGGRAR